MTKEEINAYSLRILQGSKTEVVVITYEIAEYYLDAAINCLKAQDYEGFRDNLRASKACVNELSSSLDMRYEISVSLFQIYRYMNRAFVKADISLEADELIRIRGMLEKLRLSFLTISKEDKNRSIDNSNAVYAGMTYSKNSLNIYHDAHGSRDIKI